MSLHPFYKPFRSGAFEKIKLETRFMAEFLRAPFCVGSVCSSSRSLTRTLTEMADLEDGGVVVDLGAGAGIVSRELLLCGVAPERILAVEVSSGFSKAFSRQCPGVPLVVGDARNLGNILDAHAPGKNVCAVISSLPLAVLPALVTAAVMKELYAVLETRGGVLVQYTYLWWTNFPLRQYGFSPRDSRLVLKNVPPARVEGYRPPVVKGD